VGSTPITATNPKVNYTAGNRPTLTFPLNTLFSNKAHLHSSLKKREKCSCPYTTTDKIRFL
jgi:hypothetical protein